MMMSKRFTFQKIVVLCSLIIINFSFFVPSVNAKADINQTAAAANTKAEEEEEEKAEAKAKVDLLEDKLAHTADPKRESAQGDIHNQIKQINTYMNKIKKKFETEKGWTESVHAMIADYQWKYSKVRNRMQRHRAKIQELRDMLQKMQSAEMHNAVTNDLAVAKARLDRLATEDAEGGKAYDGLLKKVAEAEGEVTKHNAKVVRKTMKGMTEKIQKIQDPADDQTTPESNDALKHLIGGSAKGTGGKGEDAKGKGKGFFLQRHQQLLLQPKSANRNIRPSSSSSSSATKNKKNLIPL